MPVEVAVDDVLIVTAEAQEPREVAGPRRDVSVLRRASWRGGAEGERGRRCNAYERAEGAERNAYNKKRV